MSVWICVCAKTKGYKIRINISDMYQNDWYLKE